VTNDLYEEFRTATRRGGRSCAVGALLVTLDTRHRQALVAALYDRTISAPAIVKVLGEWGHTPGKGQVEKHRRGDCACPK